MSAGNTFAVTGSAIYSSSQNYLTAVGAYTASASPYGAYDMGGDVFQWNEALISGAHRGVRGGSWFYILSGLQSLTRFSVYSPTEENPTFGFRVASVPEPSTGVLAVLAFGLMWMLRMRFI